MGRRMGRGSLGAREGGLGAREEADEEAEAGEFEEHMVRCMVHGRVLHAAGGPSRRKAQAGGAGGRRGRV